MTVFRRICLPALLTCVILSVAGCSESPSSNNSNGSTTHFGLCTGDDYLEDSVAASSWAEERAGIAEYVYGADVFLGYAWIHMLDAAGEELGIMEVTQLFGDPIDRDGTMQAFLREEDVAPLRIASWGEDVDRHGYTVRMRIERLDGEPSLHLEARFNTVGCWLEQEAPVAPPCAPDLPLDRAPFTLPSCGQLVDERVRAHRPPQLQRLTYMVSADQLMGEPTVGGTRIDDWHKFHSIDVFNSRGVRDEQEVTQWLSETGLDYIIGTDEERLLTTAFLDRNWWRQVEHHTAYCQVEKLPRPEPRGESSSDDEQGDIETETMNLCPGDHSNESWSESIANWVADLWGDPHLTTWDGYGYDLQAAGEYVLAEAHAGDPFIVQGRFEPLAESDVEGCGNLTWNTAAATEIEGRRISVRSHPEWEVRIGGELVTGPGDVHELGNDASIAVDDGRVTVKWGSGESAEFIQRPSSTTGTSSLTVELAVPEHRRGQVRGLLGRVDGNSRTELVLPDGTTLSQPASFEDLYERLAPAWRVRDDDSLFDYAPGEDADSFLIDDFPASPTSVDSLPADRVREAEQTCINEGVSDAHILSACVIDVVCFEDDDQAAAAADAKEPDASQPPGRHDLVVERAVRHVATPEVVEVSDQLLTCQAPAEPSISLFDEQLSTTVGEAVEVDISQPGVYTADGEFSATTVGSGTEVSSYQLTRPIPQNPDHLFAGAVRFAEPIVGVIVDEAALAATDAELGAADTTYEPAGFQGLSSARDTITISDDRRGLDLVWSGTDAHRIRVLVEAP